MDFKAATKLTPGQLVIYHTTGEAGVVTKVDGRGERNQDFVVVWVSHKHADPFWQSPIPYYAGTRPGRKLRFLEVV
jgi:hypothetical protein